MAQNIFSSINPTSTSGTQLATVLGDFKDALVSGCSGTSRPANLAAGGGWIDTTNEGTPNFYWIYKVYTGSVDVEIFRVNLSTNKVSISEADSTFEVTRISADTTAAIMKLVKQRIATSGQVVAGDVIGELQFVGHASDGSSPVVARMKAVASDTMTSGAQGAYIVLEAVTASGAVLSEMMRLVDKKLGIGVTPTKDLHVKGSNGGIMAHRASDDTTGAVLATRKERVTGSRPLASDNLGSVNYNSTDDTGVEQLVAQLLAIAVENHSTTALGSKLSFKTIAAAATSLIERMNITDVITTVARLDITALRAISQDIATAATITAMNADKLIASMTGSTTTSILSLASTGVSRVVFIHNRSTATVTVKHDYTSGTTAANRFKLPESVDIDILPQSTAAFFYDETDSRWKVLAGAGSSGGNFRTVATQTMAAGGSVAISTTAGREMLPVIGTGAVQTALSVTAPFGSTAPKDGAEKLLVGTDNDASVLVTYSDTAKGIVGDFATFELTQYKQMSCVYNAALDRYIALL